MTITYPRLVSRERGPRNALWCRAGVLALVADPTARLAVVVGDTAVPAHTPELVSGQLSVRAGQAWRWPNDEPDAVGELMLMGRTLGLSAVGWWAPTPLGDEQVLTMDVAGLTLWAGAHRICTEEHARIQAVLGD